MIAIVLIIGAILLRLVPHMPNFAPIGALALFCGAYLPKKYAIIVPLIAMMVSDYMLLYIHPFQGTANFSQLYPVTALFHAGTFAVWGSVLLIGGIGIWLRTRKSFTNVLSGSLASSVLFFLITNFGFWLTTSLYPKTIEGQMLAYAMALPFFKWTLLGDLFYTGVFFGAYEAAQLAAKRVKTAIA